jgi:hypothetical protein
LLALIALAYATNAAASAALRSAVAFAFAVLMALWIASNALARAAMRATAVLPMSPFDTQSREVMVR